MRHTQYKHSKERGFSLIELMIVIAIIGILIGVGVPAWKYMTRKGNETAAIQTMQRIQQAQVAYAADHRGEFGTFEQLRKDNALDERFTGDAPDVSGYTYILKVTPKAPGVVPSFSLNANPTQPGESGNRYFYIDPSLNTVRSNDTKEASATDPPV